jgi:shikimate dehydrogenase
MFSCDKNIRYAVIGDPIKHSLSPQMQNAGFEALAMGSPYGKFHVPLDDLAEFVAFAREHLLGFNITVPHKDSIIPFLDEIETTAQRCHSVNTVTIRDGKMSGCSTDGYGLETALMENFDIGVVGSTIFFAGCGGAVRAVSHYFASRGAKALYFANRTVAKAEELAEEIASFEPGCQVETAPIGDIEKIKSLLAQSDAVIQGTSLGLKPDDPSPLPVELLPGHICCYETIYHETAFLCAARSRGLRFADGRGMLLHQGAKSFEIWTGRKAPVEPMRAALDAAIAAK